MELKLKQKVLKIEMIHQKLMRKLSNKHQKEKTKSIRRSKKKQIF